MARNIDFDGPLSQEDLDYIAQRPWLSDEAKLRGVELVVGETTEEDGETTEDDEDELSYEDMTVAQLKDELKERELSTDGNKADLIARLEGDDES